MIKTAYILAGGLGTRLRELYADRPKALVPVCGKPFITHMIERLRDQGIHRIHIAAGYRADQMQDWARQHEVSNVSISVSVEPTPLGTAGGIKHALSCFPPEGWVLVLNGDSLLPNADIQAVAARQRNVPQARAVIAAVEMTERGQYGTVEMDEHDRIVAFREKADNERGYVNGGIYYLDPEILDGLPEGVAVSIEKEVFPKLAEAGQLGAVKVPGPLLDMGTPEGLRQTESFLAAS